MSGGKRVLIMKKLFVVTVITSALLLGLFGCSKPLDSEHTPDKGQVIFSEMEDIKAESFPVEKAMAELLNMERGTIVDRYQGTFAFGDIMGYDNTFEKLGNNNYFITYTAIDGDGNREVVNATKGNSLSIFGNRLMLKDFNVLLNKTNQLEITKLDSGSIFKYYYTVQEKEDANLFEFVGVEAYYLYLLDAEGRLTGMEVHAIYEVNNGEEHHDFIRTTILKTI